MSFLAVGKRESATKELTKIIKDDPNHIEALLLLGKIYLFLGKFKESSFYLWKVHSLKKEHSDVRQYVEIMKHKMHECLDKANENIIKGKLNMGLLWTTKSLTLYPNHPEALLLRSAILRKMGKYTDSLNDLNVASQFMTIDSK
jgi:tetratricopeptide (TPR) repeat protein